MRTSAGSVMMYSVVVSEFTYRWILKSITGNPETLTTNSTSLANNSPQGVRHVYRSSNSKNGNSSRDNETESGDNKAIYLHVPTGNQGIFEGPDPLAEVNIKVNTNDFMTLLPKQIQQIRPTQILIMHSIFKQIYIYFSIPRMIAEISFLAHRFSKCTQTNKRDSFRALLYQLSFVLDHNLHTHAHFL